MRMNRLILAALTFALLAPDVLAAQVMVRSVRRGMLGFASNEFVTSDGTVRRAIVEIVKDSPADRAGVVVGDTLVRFNGLQPRSELLSAFAPGDTVVLRLRRNGRERDVRMVAAERNYAPLINSFEMLPDSIRGTIAIMVDAVRAGVDTVKFPRLRIERLHGDSAIVYFGPDRLFAVPPDRSVPLQLDSLRSFMLQHRPGDWQVFGDSGRFHFFADSVRGSMFRMFADSGRLRIWTDTISGARGFRLRDDSTFVQSFSVQPGRTLYMDSAFVRPGEMVSRTFTMGLRAIAGAELFELNPALGETFGATEGVLVLNAAEGTPAARAGLRGGDVIVKAEGRPVTTIQSLRRTIDDVKPGSAVRLEVMRRGTRLNLNLNRQ